MPIRIPRFTKKPKVPFGAREGAIADPERAPIKPRLPGTRDVMQPKTFKTKKKNLRRKTLLAALKERK